MAWRLVVAVGLVLPVVSACTRSAEPGSGSSSGASTSGSNEAAVAAAAEAARSWLALIDAGQYDQSYDQAAAFFRKSITKAQWVIAVKTVRGQTGALVSRSRRSATFARQLPGAPDGEYVVFLFDAQFKNKAGAVETITPMLDPDKVWRVSGYFVR